MGIPDDANPLNRCLPAEVVTRKKPTKKEEKEEPALNVDAKQVHSMKPELRLKWLGKALQRCQEGKVEKTLIFDILTNAKFCHDCSSRLGAKMYRLVLAHADFFSPKQRKHLQVGDCPLRRLFKKAESDETLEGKTEAGEKSTDLAKLWDYLCSLSSEQREVEVNNLDDDTKAKLEDFLEARIAASQGSVPKTSSKTADEVEKVEKVEAQKEEKKKKSRKSKSRSRSRRRRRRSSSSSSSSDSRSKSSRRGTSQKGGHEAVVL